MIDISQGLVSVGPRVSLLRSLGTRFEPLLWLPLEPLLCLALEPLLCLPLEQRRGSTLIGEPLEEREARRFLSRGESLEESRGSKLLEERRGSKLFPRLFSCSRFSASSLPLLKSFSASSLPRS